MHITPLAYLYDIQAAAQYMGFTFDRLGLDMGYVLSPVILRAPSLTDARVAILIGTAYRGLGCLLMIIRARTGWW